jgi:hypothetical protein
MFMVYARFLFGLTLFFFFFVAEIKKNTHLPISYTPKELIKRSISSLKTKNSCPQILSLLLNTDQKTRVIFHKILKEYDEQWSENFLQEAVIFYYKKVIKEDNFNFEDIKDLNEFLIFMATYHKESLTTLFSELRTEKNFLQYLRDGYLPFLQRQHEGLRFSEQYRREYSLGNGQILDALGLVLTPEELNSVGFNFRVISTE